MEFPVVFELGQAKLPAHLVFEVLAFFVGFRYFLYLRKRQPDPVNTGNRVWAIVGAAAGALIGSRLLGSLENPEVFVSASEGWLYYYQQKTIVGGLLGGLIGVEITKKMIGESRATGDLFTFPLILAIMIGRIGCFLAGVTDGTHGNPSSVAWAMDLGDGIPRHPSALYEIIFLLVVWVVLARIRKSTSLANGAVFKLFLMTYLAYRFLAEFIKPVWQFDFGLSSIQLACLAGLIYYAILIRKPGRLFLPKPISHA